MRLEVTSELTLQKFMNARNHSSSLNDILTIWHPGTAELGGQGGQLPTQLLNTY